MSNINILPTYRFKCIQTTHMEDWMRLLLQHDDDVPGLLSLLLVPLAHQREPVLVRHPLLDVDLQLLRLPGLAVPLPLDGQLGLLAVVDVLQGDGEHVEHGAGLVAAAGLAACKEVIIIEWSIDLCSERYSEA